MVRFYGNTWGRKKKSRPEESLQIVAFNYLRALMHLQKMVYFLAFQVRNESNRGGKTEAEKKAAAIAGAIAKSMGRMSGVSDAVFLFRGGKVVFVEFKAYTPPKNNPHAPAPPDYEMSETQMAFRDAVQALGFEYRLIAARDANDVLAQVISLLRENGVPVQ